MKDSVFNGRFLFTLLFSLLSVCFYSCKDDDIPQVVVQIPGSAKTINEINANSKALQRLVVAQEAEMEIKSCVALTSSSYNIELSDGNTCTILTEITALGKGEGAVYVPSIGVKKDSGTYYWTIGNDWLNVEDAKVPVIQEHSSTPILGIGKEGYWTVECNDKMLTLNRKAEEGSIKSIFSHVDMTNTSSVTFRLSDGSLPITLKMADKDNPGIPITGHLRRPISPEQPAWLIHIDTWNTADAQKIIDLVPADIRPYVIFNIGLSVSHDETTGAFNVVEYGYETAKSWLRTCAENNVWAMIQPASGAFCHFPDYATLAEMDNSVFDEFFRDYPNFLGFNYCEQFWGFDDKFSVTYPQRLQHWTNLMKLTHTYGGYLTLSFCGPHWGASFTPVAMFKRDANFAAVCKEHPENLIVCEKYTSTYGFFNIESACLGAWLSGYAGQYGMRFDQCGWNARQWNGDEEFPVAAGAIPMIEHIMLTGQTVYDGPELIWQQDFKEVNASGTDNGYTQRNWECFPQFVNINIDIYRKIIDGTIRIMSRQEVIDRTKFVVINDIAPTNAFSDPGYLAPATLYDGLYRLDEDGVNGNQTLYFKKTGRYPTLPVVYDLADDVAKSFNYKINASQFESGYGDVQMKQSKFNRIFAEEYTGDMYVGRHENAWVAYNAYADVRNASIPFKYNTCEKIELAFAKYSVSVINEYAGKVKFYLTNYSEKGTMKTDVIKIYGSSSKPSFTYQDRATPASCSITDGWSNGVYTLTVKHNGAVDITVTCSGNAIGRETQYQPAAITIPASPEIYHGTRQYEAECFDYKNVAKVHKNAVRETDRIRNYTAMGYLNFGSRSDAAVRDQITVNDAGNYVLRIRYNAVSTVNTVDLYVNGAKVTTPEFVQSANDHISWATVSTAILLKAGRNMIELKASASASCDLYLDNMVVE